MANRKIAHAVRVALMTAGAASAGLFSGIVAAQQPLEEIVVTGTRIRDANLIASSPVATIDQDEFRFSGTTRVEDLLNAFPQLAPGFDAFTVNPTTGFATANLRGLGSERTLVLVNGHRLQPGGIRSEARDLNQIPAALVKRVEILTGGASAVYGSDAMAGVVNFILDTDFEGVSVSAGASGYQHDNDDKFLRPKMDEFGFTYPDGNRGPDGRAYNIDLALGSGFADGRGHAMAYATWRKNRELRQGARDYSSCALNSAGTVCGGSPTSPRPNFFLFHPDLTDFAHLNPDGSWAPDIGQEYNYAPINHYQRPDERWTFGSAVKYEVNRNFRPYLETMFANTNTSVQIAESGTFFRNFLTFADGDPLIGSMFGDLGLDPATPVGVLVGKRNSEGGPRISEIESNSFRFVVGTEGDLTDNWDYNVSYLYGRNSSNEANRNDFLVDRLGDALLQCPPGSFSGCIPYNVWVPGGVTEEAAAGLSGVGMQQGETALTVFSGFVTGALPFNIGAADPVSLVVGVEYRKDEYETRADVNMETNNFTGLGGPTPPLSGEYDVKEVYFEAGLPLFQGGETLQNLSMDLGYRYSDYSTSGGVNSFKIGFSAQVTDFIRFRGGFNRAIRAPQVSELFSVNQIALWGGSDPCAGATPELTQAQCANTGVTAAQYGSIPANPAAQYNQFVGGNPDLEPEEGDTITLGFVVTPIDNLQISLDYYSVEIGDRLGSIGASNVLRACALSGDPILCDRVNRRAVSGDLWVGSDPATSGFVENLNDNFGNLVWNGLDLVAQYRMDLAGGTFSTSLVGSYALKQEVEPIPGLDFATYDCAGVINIVCQQPDWRHTLRTSFSRDWYTVIARWRYTHSIDYKNQDGTPGTTDQILVGNGGALGSFSYFDLSGSFDVMDQVNLTVGVNNILDKSPPFVGADLAFNANAPQGYDQLGRFMFASVNVRF